MDRKRVFYHILFWVAYWQYEAYVEFAWISKSYESMHWLNRWWMTLQGEGSLLSIKIPLVYLLMYLVSGVSRRKLSPWIAVPAGVVAMMVAATLQRMVGYYHIMPHLYHEKPMDPLFALRNLISSFIDISVLVGVALAIRLYRTSQRARENEKRLLREKLVAELRFLRSQTNPHFLFNTLNNIYALARKKADETADAVMKLSKLLRFMLYESRSDTITINEELRVITDYIELEKIRYSDRLSVQLHHSIDDAHQPISPLILLPFVENAFKHGASESRFESSIAIEMVLDNSQLFFQIRNTKDDDSTGPVRGNIGLTNVQRQLELLYPGHRLEIDNQRDYFTVTLHLNLLNHATI